MKVRIHTYLFDRNQNFGQRLQAYALQQFLIKNFDFIDECLISDFREIKEVKDNYCQIANYEQYKLFKKFEEEYMKFAIVHSQDELLNSGIDKFIIGSDVVFKEERINSYLYVTNEKDKTKKITYAGSFGSEKNYKTSAIKKILKNFNFISVREELSKIIFKRNRMDISFNIDPAFLLSADNWKSIEKKPDFIKDGEKFSVNYMTDYRIKKNDLNEIIEEEKKGCKVYNLHKIPIGPQEFIWMIRNCEKVFSGSFHALCFSVIFNKKFVYFNRIKDSLKQRSLIKTLNLEFDSDYSIKDYAIVKDTIDIKVLEAKKYLNEALQSKECNILENDKCTGCFACYDICKFNAIKKVEINGFFYPERDETACMNCNKCKEVCPVLKRLNKKFGEKIDRDKILTKAFRLTDENEINASASGGFFAFLAKYLIMNFDATVFGVKYSSDFKSAYYSQNSFNIESFRTSKYFENDNLGVYRRVETQIKEYEGIVKDFTNDENIKFPLILFTGRPCQIAGLISYLDTKGYKYYNDILVTCELICNSIGSQIEWKSYLEKMEKVYSSEVLTVNQRSKKFYGVPATNINFLEGDSFLQPNGKNEFVRNFITNNHNRESCFNCQFKFPYGKADFIIGDANGGRNYSKIFDSKGTSVVVMTNRKAIDIYNKAKEFFSGSYIDEDISFEKMSFFNKKICESKARNEI